MLPLFSLLPALPFLQLAEIGQMLADFGFIIQVLVFSYVLFWLYMTFRDVPLLFGITTVIAAYFMFIQPIPVLFMVIIFFAFFMFGNQLQMLVLFGLEPILGVLGVGKYAQQYEMEYMAELQNKMSAGKELTDKEMKALQEGQEKQQQMQQVTGGAEHDLARRRRMQ